MLIRYIKNSVKSVLQSMDIGITRYSSLQKLTANNAASLDMDILLELPEKSVLKRLKYLRKSKSQIRQDLFVLSMLDFKQKGFFVEFGATNGIDYSNTYLMEKEFGWTGILAEPAKCWHNELKINRTAEIEMKCVYKDSKSTVQFNEVNNAALSTITTFSKSDFFSQERKAGKTYESKTISLEDLLKKYNAPKIIDYISIDTEGSEFEILSNFDFSKYSFRIITCEHNYTSAREKIYKLLLKNGYKRIYQNLSMFDDWYILGA
jgi:FkbM family methyltransferase